MYLSVNAGVNFAARVTTRSDTRLPQSHPGGQGPYLRSLDRLGRISEVKKEKKENHYKKLSVTDLSTDQLMDGQRGM